MEGKRTPSSSLLLQLTRHAPGRTALTLVDGRCQLLHWRYGDLLRQQIAAAQWLQQYGAVAGDCIVVIAGNSPQFIALMLAAMQLNCCFVPVNPHLSVDLLQTILHQLRPRVLVVEHLACAYLQHVTRLSCTRLLRLRPLHAVWLREILSHARVPSGSLASAPAVPAGTVLLLYSSGSTGAPKAILYSGAGLATFLRCQRQLFAAFPDDPAPSVTVPPSARINVLPLAHFGGLSFCLQALLDGRAVHLLSHHSAADYFALARRSGCQLLMMVPAQYEQLLQTEARAACNSSLRYCLTMGEAISPQLSAQVEEKLGVNVYTAYGMSEGLSGLGQTAARLRKGIPTGTCGQLLFGEAQLRDASGIPSQFEGELFVRNVTTAPRYLDDALNDSRYHEGWYRTGDLFRRDADGFYFCLGRADELCIINGRNLYPAEVEAVVRRHPLVADCIAAPIVLAGGRRRLGVLVVSAIGNQPPGAELLDFCLAQGALYAVPGWITFTDSIPLNAIGKRDRKTAARLLQQDHVAQQQAS